MRTFQAKVLAVETQKGMAEGLDDVTFVKLDAQGMGTISIPIKDWPGGEKTANKWMGEIVTIIADPTKAKFRVKPLRII